MGDFKEREKDLNDHLDTMTQIAQKIDYQNRELQKKNQELMIRNSSQANDKELLMTQLIAEKQQTKER